MVTASRSVGQCQHRRPFALDALIGQRLGHRGDLVCWRGAMCTRASRSWFTVRGQRELASVPLAPLPDRIRIRHVVLAAAKHVSDRYAEKLLGRDLSRSVGVSMDQLGQAFEESLGIGVRVFVTQFRISAACYLLAESDFKLERIAELTGFDDASHLSRVFVQQRGMRPGAYRRQLEVA